MPAATTLTFALAARSVAGAARASGLEVPAFRSPPRLVGTNRTVRHRPDGGVVVAVRVRGRDLADVARDLVEGTLLANHLAAREGEGQALAQGLLAAALDAVGVAAA